MCRICKNHKVLTHFRNPHKRRQEASRYVIEVTSTCRSHWPNSFRWALFAGNFQEINSNYCREDQFMNVMFVLSQQYFAAIKTENKSQIFQLADLIFNTIFQMYKRRGLYPSKEGAVCELKPRKPHKKY